MAFKGHTNEAIKKAKKGVGVIKFMSKYAPPRESLEQIYKSYVRSQIEYGDVIFHETPSNNPFSFDISEKMHQLEKIQYSAALAVSGAWKGTSYQKLYSELGWESLSQRRWFRRMCLFFKIINKSAPLYLQNCVSFPEPPRLSRFGRPLETQPQPPVCDFITRTDRFRFSFFPSCVYSWNYILDNNQRTTKTIDTFKKRLLGLFKPTKNELFGIIDREGIRRLTQLRVDLNPLRYYKYTHNFLDTSDVFCVLNDGVETCEHFLLDCGLHTASRASLLNNISLAIGLDCSTFPKNKLVKLLLYGDKMFSIETNTLILKETTHFIDITNIY